MAYAYPEKVLVDLPILEILPGLSALMPPERLGEETLSFLEKGVYRGSEFLALPASGYLQLHAGLLSQFLHHFDEVQPLVTAQEADYVTA